MTTQTSKQASDQNARSAGLNPAPKVDESLIATVAGFRLLRDTAKYDTKALKGKNLWGNLKDFTHVGLPAVSAAVDKLPLAEAVELGPSLDGKNTAESLNGFRLVRNRDSFTPFYVSSDQYAVVNAPEALHPMLDACQEAGLHIAAIIDVVDDGARIKGRAIIGNPEAVIEVLQDSGDFVLMGLQFEFRHDGTSAVRLTPFAVRVVCCNDNLWGEFLDAFTIRHIGKPEEKVAQIGEWLQSLLELVPSMRDRLQRATQVEVSKEDFLYAALGSGMAYRDLVDVAPRLSDYEPSIKQSGLTLWTGYNVLTAHASHERDSDSQQRDRVLGKAALMLDEEGMKSLIARGKEKALEQQEKRNKQKANPKERQTIQPLHPIVS